MEEYVIGVDLGTSAVKVLLVSKKGEVVDQSSESYELSQPQPGYSEQNPNDWVDGAAQAIKNVIYSSGIDPSNIKGVSYSGQMHGLVILDDKYKIIRPAILWNDTRTTKQCEDIVKKMGNDFIKITRNRPLEGFTLPKILWIKENEKENFLSTKVFLLPKDYLRFRMTNQINMDYSDAAGTVLMDVEKHRWSKKICGEFKVPLSICPELVESVHCTGTISDEFSQISGLLPETKVFAGGADNACGAIGAGIIGDNTAMLSIGTSGVLLAFEPDTSKDYKGKLHFFNHAIPGKYYSMGVTLSAGYSLSWLKNNINPDLDFTEFVKQAEKSKPGANGLLFTPYLFGERTPYADANIRGSWIGLDATQTQADLVRSVMEGIVYSFRDIQEIYEKNDKHIQEYVSVGGGAKSLLWLQMQADILGKPIIQLENEQGPGLGAAAIAQIGLGWYENFEQDSKKIVKIATTIYPNSESKEKYDFFYDKYKRIYELTKGIAHEISSYKLM